VGFQHLPLIVRTETALLLAVLRASLRVLSARTTHHTVCGCYWLVITPPNTPGLLDFHTATLRTTWVRNAPVVPNDSWLMCDRGGGVWWPVKLLRGRLSQDVCFPGLVGPHWSIEEMNTMPADYGIGVVDLGTDVRSVCPWCSTSRFVVSRCTCLVVTFFHALSAFSAEAMLRPTTLKQCTDGVSGCTPGYGTTLPLCTRPLM